MRLTYPPDAVVVVAGLPGAGKSTLIRRAVDRSAAAVVDTDDQRRAGRRASYVRHYGAILAAIWGRRPVVVHSRGTRRTLRRAIVLAASLRGRPAHPILLDAPPAEAEAGQRRRGRRLSRAAMEREVARWERTRRRGVSREGWSSVVVLDRASAAQVDSLQWDRVKSPGTTGFDAVGSWGWSRVEVPEASLNPGNNHTWRVSRLRARLAETR